ncbi:MAG: antibiotic biosynthesis monooxygenase [Bacteroidales bacterium]|nr:antibiotic biosynthesis monooxygenase [Bacteroidales bacterium]
MKQALFILSAILLLTGCIKNKYERVQEQNQEQKQDRSITVNIRYTGTNGNAWKFAEEMMFSGTVAAIRAEEGNLRYEYYQSLDDPETILLIDSWASQEAIDAHHATPMMEVIANLREKYDLHMTVERYTSAETPESENRFIRK